MSEPSALVFAERSVAVAFEKWREELGRPDGRFRVLALGEEQIRTQFIEISRTVTQLWTMQRSASLAATAATLDASLRSIDLVHDARMLIPEAVAVQNPLELRMAAGDIRYARCPGHVMILNRKAFTISGPLTPNGDPTVWICKDEALVEQAAQLHEQLWEHAKPASPPNITVRQGEVLLRLALGSSDREITKLMGISQRTLEREISTAQQVFGASGRVDLLTRLAGVTRFPLAPEAR
ncbi:MAG: hypothetical protein Q4G35_03570 [Propionibacteriaceae bacterium]|nr:hypothetical protein [Propionibacteriaceae bacterium]